MNLATPVVKRFKKRQTFASSCRKITMRERKKIIYDALTVASYFASNNTSAPDNISLAGCLGVTKNAVIGVKYGFRKIPVRWCPIIEKVTHHRIKCELLRPDIDWSVLIDRHNAEKKEDENDSELPEAVLSQMQRLNQDYREVQSGQ